MIIIITGPVGSKVLHTERVCVMRKKGHPLEEFVHFRAKHHPLEVSLSNLVYFPAHVRLFMDHLYR